MPQDSANNIDRGQEQARERSCSHYRQRRDAMTRDRLAFGVTVDQIDQLNSLLRTITANGDMVAVSSAAAGMPDRVDAARGHLQRRACHAGRARPGRRAEALTKSR